MATTQYQVNVLLNLVFGHGTVQSSAIVRLSNRVSSVVMAIGYEDVDSYQLSITWVGVLSSIAESSCRGLQSSFRHSARSTCTCTIS